MDIRTGYFHADDPFRDPSRVGMPPTVDEGLVAARVVAESFADPLAADRITYSGLRIVETTLSPFQVYRFSVLRGLVTDDAQRAARRNNTIWNGRRAKRFSQASLFADSDHALMESLAAESESGDAVSHMSELMIAQPHLQPYIDGQRLMFDPAVNTGRGRRNTQSADERDEAISAPELRPTRRKRRRRNSRIAQPPQSHFMPDSVSVGGSRPGGGRSNTHAEPVVDVDFVVRQPLGVARPVDKRRAKPVADQTVSAANIVPVTPIKKAKPPRPAVTPNRKAQTPPPSHFRPLGATVRDTEN